MGPGFMDLATQQDNGGTASFQISGLRDPSIIIGDTDVTLAMLTVKGVLDGTTLLDFTYVRIDDDDGTSLMFPFDGGFLEGPIDVIGGSIAVNNEHPTLPGMSEPSKDLDNDGKAEDINGNGRLDFADIVAFFQSLYSDEVQNNVTHFDFNGNGKIDLSDVLSLFETLISS